MRIARAVTRSSRPGSGLAGAAEHRPGDARERANREQRARQHEHALGGGKDLLDRRQERPMHLCERPADIPEAHVAFL